MKHILHFGTVSVGTVLFLLEVQSANSKVQAKVQTRKCKQINAS